MATATAGRVRSMAPAGLLLLLLGAAAASEPTCAADARGQEACLDEGARAAEDSDDEASLLGLRWPGRSQRLSPSPSPAASQPLPGDCLMYSVEFPSTLQGEGISKVLVRFAVVDPVATLLLPWAIGEKSGKKMFGVEYDGYRTPTSGNRGVGWDQFSVYYNIKEASFFTKDSTYNVTGVWPNAAYTSVEVYYGSEALVRKAYLGEELSAGFADGRQPAPPNPYVKGSPALSTYANQAACAKATGSFLELSGGEGEAVGAAAGALAQPHAAAAPRCAKTNTGVWRMPQDLTKKVGADGGTQEGACAETYLFSPGPAGAMMFKSDVSYDFAFGYIKFKVPFANNPIKGGPVAAGLKSGDNPDGWDLMEFSISSNFMMSFGVNLPFSVTSVMLEEQGFNDQGYATILFAPKSEVKKHYQGGNRPPVITLPSGLKAYLLFAPDFLFVIRYRGPSRSWQGSPYHSACKATLQEQMLSPATCDELGDYLPQITRSDVSSLQELAKEAA